MGNKTTTCREVVIYYQLIGKENYYRIERVTFYDGMRAQTRLLAAKFVIPNAGLKAIHRVVAGKVAEYWDAVVTPLPGNNGYMVTYLQPLFEAIPQTRRQQMQPRGL